MTHQQHIIQLRLESDRLEREFTEKMQAIDEKMQAIDAVLHPVSATRPPLRVLVGGAESTERRGELHAVT